MLAGLAFQHGRELAVGDDVAAGATEEAWHAHVLGYWQQCLNEGLARVEGHPGYRIENYAEAACAGRLS